MAAKMSAAKTTTKKRHRLTLQDRLSRSSFREAAKLLGPDGEQLILQGGKFEFQDLDDAVYFKGDLFRLRLPQDGAIVTITLDASARNRLRWNCDSCDRVCIHLGATFSLILEEKLALGLSAMPHEQFPFELLDANALVRRAVAEREARSRTERMTVKSVDPKSPTPWADYVVTSAHSGKSYRVALRGTAHGESFCACPDFRTNTLGTCKHILQTLRKVKGRFPAAAFNEPYRRSEPSVFLKYGTELALQLGLPDTPDRDVKQTSRGSHSHRRHQRHSRSRAAADETRRTRAQRHDLSGRRRIHPTATASTAR